MAIKATIDRFEEGKAVLIVGEDKHEFIVPNTLLLHGVIQGSWLLVMVENDHIDNVVISEKETAMLKGGLAKKIARLRRWWGHRQLST